jgi:hypothetical protein
MANLPTLHVVIKLKTPAPPVPRDILPTTPPQPRPDLLPFTLRHFFGVTVGL